MKLSSIFTRRQLQAEVAALTTHVELLTKAQIKTVQIIDRQNELLADMAAESAKLTGKIKDRLAVELLLDHDVEKAMAWAKPDRTETRQ